MGSVSSVNSLLSSATSSSSSQSTDLSSLLAAATGATSVGIDVTAAVNAAVYAAQAPERQWQAQQATLQSQMMAVSSIQTALSSVSADLESLNDLQGALSSKTVTSSDPAVATATASSTAAVGTHTVDVTSLASKGSWYSSALPSASASLGTYTLSITKQDGTQANFSLGPNGISSLSALETAINADKLGITASVVNDANGSRLAMVSDATGTAAGFTVGEDDAPGPSWRSSSVASTSSTLVAGTFQVGDGTSTATINVAAGSSLSDVANQIDSAGLSVSASVVSDNSGAHLEIDGSAANSVTVSSDPVFSMTQASAAQNASLTVDGVPISSASNTVTGAIPGVTLNLAGVTANSPVSLTVGADMSQISSAIGQFVTSYNSAVTLVNSQFNYSTSTQTEGALGSDGTVRSLQSALLSMAEFNAGSTSPTNASFSTLASLGITMNDDGTLAVNGTALNEAIQSNSSAVQSFFQGSSLNGFASMATSALKSFSDPAGGALVLDSANLTSQYNALQTEVSNYESGYIAPQRTILTSMYSKAEIALQQLPTTMKQLQAQLGQNSGG